MKQNNLGSFLTRLPLILVLLPVFLLLFVYVPFPLSFSLVWRRAQTWGDLSTCQGSSSQGEEGTTFDPGSEPRTCPPWAAWLSWRYDDQLGLPTCLLTEICVAWWTMILHKQKKIIQKFNQFRWSKQETNDYLAKFPEMNFSVNLPNIKMFISFKKKKGTSTLMN